VFLDISYPASFEKYLEYDSENQLSKKQKSGGIQRRGSSVSFGKKEEEGV
jgi:hypothetical protein